MSQCDRLKEWLEQHGTPEPDFHGYWLNPAPRLLLNTGCALNLCG